MSAALLALAAWAGVFVLVAGCNSWEGESSVTLRDGTTYRCLSLRLNSSNLHCGQKHGARVINWADVAGYRAGDAR